MELVQATAVVLWIPATAAVIMALILLLVSTRLSTRSRIAARFPRFGCGQVRAGPGPLHVRGTSAPGPAGPLHSALTGTSCVWYRSRLLRRHWITRMRYTSDEWAEVDELAEEQIWSWRPMPAPVRSRSGVCPRCRPIPAAQTPPRR